MRTASFLAAAAILASLSGCGSEDDKVPLIPVTGTVSLNGKPLADATVSFMPASENANSTPGVDSTGPEGTFKLKWKSRAGVAAGKYKVTITPALAVGGKVPEEFKDDPYMAQLSQTGGGMEKKKEAAGEVSEFDAEVSADNKEFDFDVKAKAKAKP